MTILILLTLSISIQPSYSTNTTYIYELTGRDSVVYCATNGGLLAFNKSSNDYTTLTNTDGLQQNRLSCVGLDSSGHIWTGNQSGLALVERDFSNIHIYPVECLTCTRVQNVVCRKDSIYVGSSNGFLFIDTKGTPLDFDDDTQIKIFEMQSNDVRSIAVDDTSVWVGTASGGITHFSKDFITAQNYTIDHGLLTNQINSLMIFQDQLYVATTAGINRFATDHFDTVLTNYDVNDLEFLGDSIVLALDSIFQVGVFYGGNITIINSGLPWRTSVLSLLNMNGELHCGLGNRYNKDYFGDGIGTYDANNNVWSVMKHECLPSNHISEITANEHGVFVACGNRTNLSKGFGWLQDNSQWISSSWDSILPSNHVHRCTTAPDGIVWLGYNAFPDNDSSIMLSSFDPSQNVWNDVPNRYNGMEGCEAVWDVEFDDRQNMYLTLAGPTDKVWLIDSALDVVYYLNPQFAVFNVEIALDSAGVIWRTHTDAGISKIDTRNTLFDRNDDDYRNFGTADGLLSNYTRGCVVDKNNNLYIATDEGLVIYDGISFSSRTDISDSELLDLELDSQGRIWILARDGVYFLDPEWNIIDGWRFSDLNIQIDFLESIGEMIQVQGFEFDPTRNCFWIGGETGLLKFGIEFDSIPEAGAATIYPNPVLHDILRIKDIPADALVDIFAISGRRVAHDLIPDPVFGEVLWHIPEDLGSGMYFALVKSEQQGSRTYKFAIVR